MRAPVPRQSRRFLCEHGVFAEVLAQLAGIGEIQHRGQQRQRSELRFAAFRHDARCAVSEDCGRVPLSTTTSRGVLMCRPLCEMVSRARRWRQHGTLDYEPRFEQAQLDLGPIWPPSARVSWQSRHGVPRLRRWRRSASRMRPSGVRLSSRVPAGAVWERAVAQASHRVFGRSRRYPPVLAKRANVPFA